LFTMSSATLRYQLSLLLLCILTISSEAQFVQRWHWINGRPFWRRFPDDTNARPVLNRTYEVVLEYNCYFMPAICTNVRKWVRDSARSEWAGREGAYIFTLDLRANKRVRLRTGTRLSAKVRSNRVLQRQVF